MAILIDRERDFKGGKYDIPDAVGNFTKNDVQAIITAYEKPAIYKLLGVAEGDKIIAYLAAGKTPVNADYNKILDPFTEDNANVHGGIAISLGMLEYLKGFIFYEYNKNALKTSQAGVTNADAETATIQGVNSTMRFAENKFNDVLGTADAIQWYCMKNSTAFPDFNGKRIVVKASNIL